MKNNYDFGKSKSRRNPFAVRLKKQGEVNVVLTEDEAFDERKDEPNLPYEAVVKDLKKRGKI